MKHMSSPPDSVVGQSQIEHERQTIASGLVECSELISWELTCLKADLDFFRSARSNRLAVSFLADANAHPQSTRKQSTGKNVRRSPRVDPYKAERKFIAAQLKPDCVTPAKLVIAAIQRGFLLMPRAAYRRISILDDVPKKDKQFEHFWKVDVVRPLYSALRSRNDARDEDDYYGVGQFSEYRNWYEACVLLAASIRSTKPPHAPEPAGLSLAVDLQPSVQVGTIASTTTSVSTPVSNSILLKTRELKDREALALEALVELKAINRDVRQTSEQIARKADGKNGVGDSYKHALANLAGLGYTASEQGSRGGHWILDAGVAALEEYNQRK